MENRVFTPKFFFQTAQGKMVLIFLGLVILGTIFFLDYTAYGDVVEKKITESIKKIKQPEKIQIKAPSGNVYIGSTVTFSGQYRLNNIPTENISIAIINKLNNQVIGTDNTNSKGMFSIKWTPKNIGTYEIYARTPADLIGPTSSLSNSIFVNVVNPTSKYLVHLSASTLNDKGKNNIKFFGSFTDNKKPLDNYLITIHDNDTGKLITQTRTDSQGKYSINWSLSPRNTSYQFYAISWDPIKNTELDRSNFVNVKVKQISEPPIRSELILNTLPSKFVEGDVINITGFVTSQGFSGNRVVVKMNGDTNLMDKINDQGEFSVKWKVTHDFVGFVEISAECLYDGTKLQSGKQVIDVEPLPEIVLPLNVQIISSISGLSPLDIQFESRVSGGVPPYKYLWDMGNDHRSSKEDLMMKYRQDGNYDVLLTVTDSRGNAKQDFKAITVKEIIHIPQPKILIQGSLVEGSSITFVADGHFPVDVKTYKWKFDDGTLFSGKEIIHVFRDDGLHDVELSVIDVKDSKASVKKEIKISNTSPEIIKFTADSYKADTNEWIQFYGEFSDDGLDDIHTVELFVNGKSVSLEDRAVAGTFVQDQKFETPGNYLIKLSVTDDDGDNASKEVNLQITEFPWLFLGLGISVAAGMGGLATKSLLMSQTTSGQTNVIEDQQSDWHSSDENNENQVITSDVDIEVNWGFDK